MNIWQSYLTEASRILEGQKRQGWIKRDASKGDLKSLARQNGLTFKETGIRMRSVRKMAKAWAMHENDRPVSRLMPLPEWINAYKVGKVQLRLDHGA